MQTILELEPQSNIEEKAVIEESENNNKAGKTRSDKNEYMTLLLKELAQDEYKYDLRFWSDKKITLEAIKKIADGQLPVMHHRIEHVIREITKSGGSPEQIYQVMLENYKSRVKKLSEHWWHELNNFYKTILQRGVLSKNLTEIVDWGKNASQSYQDYKMFCEYIDEKPQPEPEFIEQARQVYFKLKQVQK